MHLLRNKEIKKYLTAALLIICLGTFAGYLISPVTACVVFATAALLSLLFVIQTVHRYRDIRVLSSRIDEILHGNELLLPEHFAEGDLEILRDEIYKLIIRLQEQAEQLTLDKRQLADALADISHQLRTPLTSVYLMTERLKQTPDDRTRRTLLRSMDQMLSRIDWLITTLLKMSKLDAGSISFQLQECALSEFLSDALKPLEIAMELRGQTSEILCDESIHILCDRTWTLEAIGNVLKNCIDYTPDGRPLFIRASENPLYVELKITDSGNGIPKEDLPHLFERFYRGKNAGKDSFGIGLALSRMILSRENAVIFAGNSPEGSGQFTIRFYKNPAV